MDYLQRYEQDVATLADAIGSGDESTVRFFIESGSETFLEKLFIVATAAMRSNSLNCYSIGREFDVTPETLKPLFAPIAKMESAERFFASVHEENETAVLASIICWRDVSLSTVRLIADGALHVLENPETIGHG